MSDFNAFPPSDAAKSPAWMIIFADLLALMLTFFVLMFSMNAVQVDDWRSVADTLSDRLNPVRSQVQDKPWGGHEGATVNLPLGKNLSYIATVLAEKLAADPVLKESRVRFLGDRVAISIPADLLFKAGAAKISDPAAYAALAELAAMLRHIDNHITVVGYMDPAPTEGTPYPSPWELSLGRALFIARILKQSGYRGPLAVLGYGERRFGTLLDGLPPALQARLARRVDIVIRDTAAE